MPAKTFEDIWIVDLDANQVSIFLKGSGVKNSIPSSDIDLAVQVENDRIPVFHEDYAYNYFYSIILDYSTITSRAVF